MVTQKLDMRGFLVKRKRCYLDTGIAQAIKSRLLRATIERARGDPQAKLFIERDTPHAVGHAKRRVINSEKEAG